MKPGILLIRADANVSLGTGHVMRCLALAQAWRDRGGSVGLVAGELPVALADRLEAEAISLTMTAALPGSPDDAAATIAQARQLGAGWVVIDGDRFRDGFLNLLHDAALRVLLVDDFADRSFFPVELIVNPNPGVDSETYRGRAEGAKVLAGLHYCLLRREFYAVAGERERSAGIGNRVLISLGGSDPENLTPRIAAALAGSADLQLTVVAGPANPVTDYLRPLNAPNVRVIHDAKNMAKLMSDADIAVIAAGGTLWELLAMGCAVLSYSRNAMQRSIVQSLATDGAAIDMGDTASFDPAPLAREVKRLSESSAARERMAGLGRNLVDGAGAARVVDAMLQSGAR
jgi:UDP-2,4-diacetamido-2,4,6-trideoxy-beta-L-altropyranose hydrolase